ncbi:hypothetical protein DICPUDRAFT_149032 [Dictyostelium purpureum]|uniref:RRM domain-containing protein n=1 Tax=Dictyostelium purpureum TaxID=5786 RepID=F0ZCN0_DICPU|nr:uncharacterized protein DICPUDRAFT_149032 [Dictyostelium purpureum]EGC38300.1 hypothetical protein DICPUDRAFT_149032 [Dictyostelium purpureum]|eukprot:XP_003285161.1 hypothetical protein DICPUDRAFT_149032 [Dictyostelium purpureum]
MHSSFQNNTPKNNSDIFNSNTNSNIKYTTNSSKLNNINDINNGVFKLVVKNVPANANVEDLTNLFTPFNHLQYKALEGNMKGTVFVDFQNREDCERALKQLHGSKMGGRTLKVEISTGKKKDSKNNTSNNNSNGDNSNNGDGYNINMGIADPSQSVINEITYYLQTRPDFYSQVLNIMSLMNIKLYSKPEIIRQWPLYSQHFEPQPSTQNPPLPEISKNIDEKKSFKRGIDYEESLVNKIVDIKDKKKDEEEDEEEEEWVSDDDVTKNIDPSVIEYTNKLFPSVISPRVLKKVKLSINNNNCIKNQQTTGSKGSEVLLNENIKNKIDKKDVNSDIDNSSSNSNNINTDDNNIEKNNIIDNNNEKKNINFNLNINNEIKDIVTIEQINSNKCTVEEIESIIKGKLNIGEPSNKLYIKNISKHVKSSDFESLFRTLFDSAESMKSNLHIDYHQGGRLHGQAFITFPTTELAITALQQSQGYKFNQKPIIICFSKNKIK